MNQAQGGKHPHHVNTVKYCNHSMFPFSKLQLKLALYNHREFDDIKPTTELVEGWTCLLVENRHVH